MSQHIFNSNLTKQTNLESTINNKKSFISTIISKINFESMLDGFTPSYTWLAKFIQNNTITVSKINLLISGHANFISGSLNILVDNAKITLNSNPTARFIQNNIINAVMSMIKSAGNATFRNISNIYTRLIDKVFVNSVSISSNEIITVTIVAKKYYLVSDWDASLLSDLDSMNLLDMDYQVV